MSLSCVHTDAGKKVFCYYSSFAQNRQGVGKFLPEDIDPYLCTHIIFAFVDINQRGTDLMAFNRNDVGPSGKCRGHSVVVSLQALVYDILPSTTAVFSYAIGSRKLSVNEQFFVGAQTVSKFVINN